MAMGVESLDYELKNRLKWEQKGQELEAMIEQSDSRGAKYRCVF